MLYPAGERRGECPDPVSSTSPESRTMFRPWLEGIDTALGGLLTWRVLNVENPRPAPVRSPYALAGWSPRRIASRREIFVVAHCMFVWARQVLNLRLPRSASYPRGSGV